MMNSERYIVLYNSLADYQASQKANQQLMQLQAKEDSWKIAKQLIYNQQYHVHGCQLLSKKLNRPYTHQQQSRQKLAQFITSLPILNNTLYLSLSKLALHLNWQSIEQNLKQPYNNIQTVLNILKNIGSASAVVRLSQNRDQRQITKLLFKKYQQLLVKVFNDYTNDVIQIIENYIQEGYKLQSEILFKCLLTQPIDKVSQILQNLLTREKYQSMSNQVYQYLMRNNNNNNNTQYFIVLLAFASSLDLLNLNVQVVTYIFTKILQNMHKQINLNQQQRKNVTYIIDSFQFWCALPQKINKQLVNPQKQKQVRICLDAFVELWKIVVQRSMQIQMPIFKPPQNVDPLAIDLQQFDQVAINLDEVQGGYFGLMQQCSNYRKFRSTAQDFLSICYGILSKNKQFERKALSFIFQLTQSQNPLHLQLAIFVMSSIVQSATESIQQINALIESITQNNNAKSPYIWQQLIKLIGKLGSQTICDLRIFKTALIILKQSIQISQLEILAAQNLNQILQTCNKSVEKIKQTPILQQLFDYIYTNIYFKTNNQKLFTKLTKSTLLFIYYFRPDIQYFKQYLVALNLKIQQMSKIQDRCEIIQNLAILHNFILSQYSLPFLSTLSQFLVTFMPVILSQIQKCKQIKHINKLMGKLGTMIGIAGGYNTQIWVEGLIILINLQKVREQKTYIIVLCNKLMSVQNYDNNYQSCLAKLITNIETYVTDSLIQSPQSSIKLINNCLTFHFNILNKYVNLMNNYNPDRVLNFIVAKIFKNYLRFQYQSTRTSLAIVRNIMARNYHVEELLQQTLKVYPKLVDLLWKSLQAILCQAYKIGGSQIYQKVFAKVHPSILPPNPLFQVLINAFKNSNSKDVKNLLASLN